MHRYCAGVTEAHYESLEKSPLPFNCSLCVQKSQTALIEELKSAIVKLTAEVTELRGALKVQKESQVPSTLQRVGPENRGNRDNRRKWTEVVGHSSRRQNATSKRTKPAPKTLAASSGSGVSSVANKRGTRIPVAGVRRVWGTLKYTPPSAVLSAIKKLTTPDLECKLSIKRKFKENSSGRDRWWFLLKGDETVMTCRTRRNVGKNRLPNWMET